MGGGASRSRARAHDADRSDADLLAAAFSLRRLAPAPRSVLACRELADVGEAPSVDDSGGEAARPGPRSAVALPASLRRPAPTLEAPLSAEREPERARACSVVCDAAASVEA
jgi:hypothetical protein